MLTTVQKAVAWAQGYSIWPDMFGLACCAIEMIAIVTSRYDIARFGAEVFRSSPRQADLMIVSGTVTWKMAPAVRRVYVQMPEPKWVHRHGRLRELGGPFAATPSCRASTRIVPVDVYVPGCPPRPESLLEGIVMLQEKIQAGVPAAYESGAGRVDAVRGVPPAGGGAGTRRRDRRSSSSASACARRRLARDEAGFNFLSDVAAPTTSAGTSPARRRLLGRPARARHQPARIVGPAAARPEAAPLLGLLPPAAGRVGRPRGAAPSSQVWCDDEEPRAERRLASGRPPTGTSARRGT